MKVNKHIEKPAYIFGVPMNEFFLVVMMFVVVMLITVLLGSFGFPYIKTLLFGGLFICWALFLFVKWGSSKNYPGFLLSIISFRFFQPKKVDVKGFKIKIK